MHPLPAYHAPMDLLVMILLTLFPVHREHIGTMLEM